jgi:hypothetical protein
MFLLESNGIFLKKIKKESDYDGQILKKQTRGRFLRLHPKKVTGEPSLCFPISKAEIVLR